jgi:hypothetical protein
MNRNLAKPKSPVPEKWFNNAIVDGVMHLYALSLNGCPASDMIKNTTLIWVETIWELKSENWTQQLDEKRIYTAFKGLYAVCDRWPTIKDFLTNLPPREQVFLKKEEDDEPELSEEQLQANQMYRDAIIELTLKKGFTTSEWIARFLFCKEDEVQDIARQFNIKPEVITHPLKPYLKISFWKKDWFMDAKKTRELERAKAYEQQHYEGVGVRAQNAR